MKQLICLGLTLLLFTACGREEAATYQAPKELPPTAMGQQEEIAAVQAAHASMMAQAPAGATFSCELPDGWVEIPGSGMRKVSYTIGGSSIDFYLISLSMGDVPSNVNRWRGQVGLTETSSEDIAKDVQTFSVGEHPVKYIEVYNEDSGKGIIAAIIDLNPEYWYFTAKGSVDELKANAAGIRSFIESIKIH